MKITKYIFPFLLLLFVQCAKQYNLTDTRSRNIAVSSDTFFVSNAQTHKTIAPYKAKLDSLMAEELCNNDQDLFKSLPEGTLGNFVCDEIFDYATKHLQAKADFCMYNNGGLRINNLPKGKVRIGKVYELCPFENTLVLVELSGNDCKALFELIAQNKGTPCSKQFNMKINKASAQDILINNQAFNTNKSYFILTNDYVANGGDKTEPMKRALNKKVFEITIRQLLINSLRTRGKENNPIKVTKDGRITEIE